MEKLIQRIEHLNRESPLQHKGENIEQKMEWIEREKDEIIKETLTLLKKLQSKIFKFI